ncbi:PIN domain-containing protein [Halococcus sp. PRR34]|uniref:type II toxin-antitoxin system VapC family toxin n=1 Tax=Halococcus sp. PRR34 TaxID=3020830 RepID=UPI002360AA61|nr:PIN domain-containing protein [Halococcus sp. PRR34]
MAGASSDARLFDSSVLFGAVNARDANHDVALRLVKGVDGGTLPDAVVIESVLAETLNGIHGRVSHEAAVDFLDRLEVNARFHVERSNAEMIASAKALFRTRERLSFVDVLIVAAARTADIEYVYSFDDDFDGIDGVTRLDTPANPYDPEE